MRVLVRPDLSPAIGAGHAMRDLALAEELVARGHHVDFACSTRGLAWVKEAIVARGCSLVGPSDGPLTELARMTRADVVVVDSYTLPKREYLLLMGREVPLVSIVDFERERAVGDLVVDPSPALSTDKYGSALAVLSGLQYALVRREFRESGPGSAERAPLRVLVAFGGTDALGAAADMARRVLALGLPLALTVVARDDLVAEIKGLPLSSDQHLTIIRPGDNFAVLARRHDVVVSAAGSTSLELLALGAAVGLVCVADNQERYYEALAEADAVIPVATLDSLRAHDPAIDTALHELLGDADRRRTLRVGARSAVDGHGPARIADALEGLRRLSPGSAPLV